MLSVVNEIAKYEYRFIVKELIEIYFHVIIVIELNIEERIVYSITRKIFTYFYVIIIWYQCKD